MQDTQVAADGFTYEAETSIGWLEIQLENLDLIPNRSLRSAIQEWLQQRFSLFYSAKTIAALNIVSSLVSVFSMLDCQFLVARD
ncbi:hypothetical protein Peur_059676 [Populus x canadensis]|jgi:hypothetical protein